MHLSTFFIICIRMLSCEHQSFVQVTKNLEMHKLYICRKRGTGLILRG
jgi:hypothetical protein